MENSSGVDRTGTDSSAEDLQMETTAVEIQRVRFLTQSIILEGK